MKLPLHMTYVYVNGALKTVKDVMNDSALKVELTQQRQLILKIAPTNTYTMYIHLISYLLLVYEFYR